MTSLGIDEKLEGALCYLLGWVTGVIFYLLEEESQFVKFHAMQSILTFLPLTAIIWLFSIIPFIGWIIAGLMALLALVLWIVLIIKAYQGEKFLLPIIGEIAENLTKRNR